MGAEHQIRDRQDSELLQFHADAEFQNGITNGLVHVSPKAKHSIADEVLPKAAAHVAAAMSTQKASAPGDRVAVEATVIAEGAKHKAGQAPMNASTGREALFRSMEALQRSMEAATQQRVEQEECMTPR